MVAIHRVFNSTKTPGTWIRPSFLRIALLALFVFAGAGCSATDTSNSAAQVQAPTAAPASPVPPTSAPSAQVAATPFTDNTSSTSPTAAPASSASDWTMYHRDNVRSGYVANLTDPTNLAIVWNTPLDGAVYAEPLVIGGQVIVATEGDSLYALDANTGKVTWQAKMGDPVTRADLPCGNISPLGITGTPIYDPATGLVFAVAEVTGPAHILVGVDAKTGQVRVKRPIDLPGVDPTVHQQRAALALYQGTVYVAFGGLFGDCGNYHGMVVGARTDGTGPLLVYTVPTAREGGIWAPPGPVIDASGRLFVSVGNGAEVVGSWDHTDSVLRLSSSLALEDGFAPSQWMQDNLTDADLGSLGPVLTPGGFVFIAGKSGIGYLLRADALGGVGGQVATKPACHAYGGAAIVGSTVFVPCNEGVQQIQIGQNDFTLGWQAKGVAGSPVLGGKTVYALSRDGTLYALDSVSGKTRATVPVGSVTRFATPTLSGNMIFVGTTNGIVAVRGS